MSFTQQEKNKLIFHTCDAFSAHGGLRHAFASRLGGVSRPPFDSLNLGRSRGDEPEAVRENYRRLSAALGGSLEPLVMCRQIHSDRVLTVTQEDALPDLYESNIPEADGLVTNVPGLTLAVFYADCIPVLLFDPVQRVVGAVHSGWRGTARGIAAKAVARMCEDFGSRPADILAAIGPGICPTCFQTHDDVPQALRAQMGPEAEPFILPLSDEKFAVDLKGLIAHTLRRQALSSSHIVSLPLCTSCQPTLYWSHRRLGEQRGNQAAVITLVP